MSAAPPSGDRIAKLVRINMIMSTALVVCFIATIFALKAATSSKVVAIATDARGNVVPVVPLNEQFLNEPRIVGFAEECVRRAFSHDFLHYAQTLVDAQPCFTPSAADKYAMAMQGFFKTMDDKRMNMAIVVRKPPAVLRVYEIGGVIHWDLQVDIDISFEGRNERIPPTRNRVDMTVRRMPLEAAPRGVAIDKFSVGPVTAS